MWWCASPSCHSDGEVRPNNGWQRYIVPMAVEASRWSKPPAFANRRSPRRDSTSLSSIPIILTMKRRTSLRILIRSDQTSPSLHSQIGFDSTGRHYSTKLDSSMGRTEDTNAFGWFLMSRCESLSFGVRAHQSKHQTRLRISRTKSQLDTQWYSVLPLAVMMGILRMKSCFAQHGLLSAYHSIVAFSPSAQETRGSQFRALLIFDQSPLWRIT